MDAALRLDHAAAAMAFEGVAIRQQAIEHRGVQRIAIALAHQRSVVDETERGQRVQLILRRARHFADAIDVLDAQPPLATDTTREQPAAERGQR